MTTPISETRCDHGISIDLPCQACEKASLFASRRQVLSTKLDPAFVEILDEIDPHGRGVKSEAIRDWLRRFEREGVPLPLKFRPLVRWLGGLPIRSARSISGKIGALPCRKAADGRELVRVAARSSGLWALRRFE